MTRHQREYADHRKAQDEREERLGCYLMWRHRGLSHHGAVAITEMVFGL